MYSTYLMGRKEDVEGKRRKSEVCAIYLSGYARYFTLADGSKY